MSIGDPPPGMIWNDCIGWHWPIQFFGCDFGEPSLLKPLICIGEGDPASDPGLRDGSPEALWFWQ